MGHLGYFHGLIAHLELGASAVQQLQSALDRKSEDDVSRLVAELDRQSCRQSLPLPPAAAGAIQGLGSLAGTQGMGILGRAQALALNAQMAEAVDRLRAVETRLDHYGLKAYFDIDLADVRGMDYYTGVTFKAYTPHMGFSVVNGGRYDNLVGHFGPSQPAVGCAFYLDRILLARPPIPTGHQSCP